MGERYDRIANQAREIYGWSLDVVAAEEVVYQELMELLIEPLDSVQHQWDDSENRSAVMLLISRLFNDLQAAHHLALLGLTEQSIHGLRDAVECMLLIRLFDAEPNLALRYLKYAKEYSAGNCVAILKQKKIDPPEYQLYTMLSTLAHPNVFGAVAHVSEERLPEGILRIYHFGGFKNALWIRQELRNLLGCLGLALVAVLPPIYAPVMHDFKGWASRVLEAVDKLPALGMDVQTQPLEMSQLPADSRVALRKLQEKMSFRFRPLPKLDKMMWIHPEAGIKRGSHKVSEEADG